MIRWRKHALDGLLVFFPAALILRWTGAADPLVFACAALAIVPLAGWMGRSTEHLAARLGAGVGGLLNATFGNAAELILGALALRHGLVDVVKASITGSIIGNLLLVAGLSILAGGLHYARQRFNRTAASLGATLLTVSVSALVIPAVFHEVARHEIATGAISRARDAVVEHELSLEICVVLAFVYLLNLLFSLKTHKDLFMGEPAADDDAHQAHWGPKKALAVLLMATAAVAVSSEILVSTVEATARSWGLSDLFIGVIVIAIIGNAAEHSTAVLMALKNKMDISLNIAVGSSLQIALFVAPVLVFLSYAFGRPMDLRFSTFEILAVILSVALINLVSQDGESHWMEGVLLLALYLILAGAFYFLPA